MPHSRIAGVAFWLKRPGEGAVPAAGDDPVGVSAGRARWMWRLAFAGLACGFVFVPAAAAHTDSPARHLTSWNILVTVTQNAPTGTTPKMLAPALGGYASFHVQFSDSVGGCSQITATMTVTGANAQAPVSHQGGSSVSDFVYVGANPGMDTVKFTFGKSVCQGTSDFTIVPARTVFKVSWANDFKQRTHCTSDKTPLGPSQVWGLYYRGGCSAEPVAEGTGSVEESATDVRLSAPQIPFEFTRTYTTASGWSMGVYGSSVVVDTSVTPNIAYVRIWPQQLLFTKRADGSWAPPSWSTAQLVGSRNDGFTLTQADRTAWSFSPTMGLLTAISKNGQTEAVNVNNFNGRLTSVTTTNGRTVIFGYDASGRINKVTLPDGRFVSYAYTGQGLLSTVTDLRGGTTQYTYDTQQLLATVVDARGHTVLTNTYDSLGRLLTQTDALGKQTTYSYDWGTCVPTGEIVTDEYGGSWCTNPQVTETDPRGGVWIDEFTPDGELVKGKDALGNVTTYTYDSTSGEPATYTDPLGNAESFQFDTNHNLTQTTLPGPITTSATYTGVADLATSTNGRNYTTSYTYDTNGNPTVITEPGGATVGMAYNTRGELTSLTDETNRTTTYGYDTLGQQTSMTSPSGNKTTYGYDSSGRLTSTVDPRGNVTGADPNQYKTTITYDNGDAVKTVTDALGHTTTYGYDADGNLISRTDPNNHTWTYTYDADNQLTTVTAPDLSTTTYTYDNAGNLLSRTDANNHTTLYTYDSDNRLITIVDPLNRQWILHYDADSNLTSITTPSNGTITYTYDALGRRTGVSYSDGTPSVTWTYDADGNRASMADGTGTTTYTYDQHDRLTGTTHGSDTFAYTYDAAGRITSRTYPDTTTTTYTYDNDGRMATAVTGSNTTSYQYDPASNLTQTTLPNNVIETAAYDPAGQLTQLNDGFRTFTYGYDPAGNVTSRTIGSASTAYSYDALDRLTEISGPAGAIQYGYDLVGNRTSLTDPSGSTSYAYDAADELASAVGPSGATSYAYDQNGNETSAGAWTYTVNLADQMTRANNGSDTVTYTYDGDGNRATTTQNDTTSSLVWDENFALPQLTLERDSGGALLRRYNYGLSRISMSTPSTTAYYSSDATGSVTEMSGTTGTNLGQYDSDPFGNGATATGVDPSVASSPFGFAGEYRDLTTGLYDLRAREYDPATGRFLAIDPLGAQDHANAYAYVANNPLGFIDPSGLKRRPVSGPCAGLLCPHPHPHPKGDPFPSATPSGHPKTCNGLRCIVANDAWDECKRLIMVGLSCIAIGTDTVHPEGEQPDEPVIVHPGPAKPGPVAGAGGKPGAGGEGEDGGGEGGDDPDKL